MNRLIIILACQLWMLVPAIGQINKLVHPGIIFNQEDLDRMKRLKDKEPWASGWKALCNDKHSQVDYQMKGPKLEIGRDVIDAKGKAIWLNLSYYIDDSQAAMYQALLWYITGEEKYATNARNIVVGWAQINKLMTGATPRLEVGASIKYMAAAAEILRAHYPKWSEKDTHIVQKYFREVAWPVIGGKADGTIPKLSPANQANIELAGALAIAVFCNDLTMTNNCMYEYLYHPSGGVLWNTLENGQVSDMGRDQGHGAGQTKDMILFAEMALKQGMDLYGAMDNRVGKTIDYYSASNAARPRMWYPAGCAYNYCPTANYNIDGRATYFDVPYTRQDYLMALELADGAYGKWKGVKLPGVTLYRKSLQDGIETFLYHKPDDWKPKVSTRVPLYQEIVPAQVNTSKLEKSLIETDADDKGSFQYCKMDGDGAIVVRIASMSTTDERSRAGLMVRESLNPDARMINYWLEGGGAKNECLLQFDRREEDGGKVIHYGRVNSFWAPYWVKIERRGSQFSVYHSPDGILWTNKGFCYIEMPKTLMVGLWATDEKATFDSFYLGNDEKQKSIIEAARKKQLAEGAEVLPSPGAVSTKKIQSIYFVNQSNVGVISLTAGAQEVAKSTNGLPVHFRIEDPRILKEVDGKLVPLHRGVTHVWAYQNESEDWGQAARINQQIEVTDPTIKKNELAEGVYYIRWDNSQYDFIDYDWNSFYLTADSTTAYWQWLHTTENIDLRRYQQWQVKLEKVNSVNDLKRFKITNIATGASLTNNGELTSKWNNATRSPDLYYNTKQKAWAIQSIGRGSNATWQIDEKKRTTVLIPFDSWIKDFPFIFERVE